MRSASSDEIRSLTGSRLPQECILTAIKPLQNTYNRILTRPVLPFDEGLIDQTSIIYPGLAPFHARPTLKSSVSRLTLAP